MSKVVAKSIRNAQYQELKNGDLAILLFRESCPFSRDFKPTWNRVAKELQNRWYKGSVVYDDESSEASSYGGSDDSRSKSGGSVQKKLRVAKPPHVKKLDITKFPGVKNAIGFPTVPCIALYKKGFPVMFLTTKDRSLPNVLKQVEDYYKRQQFPPKGEHLIGNFYFFFFFFILFQGLYMEPGQEKKSRDKSLENHRNQVHP